MATATEEMIQKLSDVLMAPLREIGELLAGEIDKTNERVDDLEAKLIEKGVL